MAPPAQQSPQNEPPTFHEKSPFKDGITTAAGSAGFGLLVSAFQNSMAQHKEGAMGVFTRTGGTIAFFTAVGGVFSFTQSALANVRHADGPLNAAAGGCAAGFVVGARAGSVPMMFGTCLGLGALLGTFEAAGNSLRGSFGHPTPLSALADAEGRTEGDWREERDRRRKSFFKPRKETVSE